MQKSEMLQLVYSEGSSSTIKNCLLPKSISSIPVDVNTLPSSYITKLWCILQRLNEFCSMQLVVDVR